MTTALMERETTAPAVTSEQLALVKQTIAQGATDAELKLYLYDCARQGVHPLDRLLHFTKRGGKYTPVTSIDLMRTRAADTGEYAGSDDAVFAMNQVRESAYPESAGVTVWRLVGGIRCPFTATARWAEYYPGDGPGGTMWRKMPHTMLAKCAEALALRKGFPRQLAGLYAKEELDQAGNGHAAPITPDPPATVIDTRTGEEVPAAAKPHAPDGYRYIDSYKKSGEWHEVVLLDFDAQGGSIRLSTKRDQIGQILMQAYQDGVPIRVDDYTPKRNRVGEGYVNKLTTWKPGQEPELDDELPPLTDDDIPF